MRPGPVGEVAGLEPRGRGFEPQYTQHHPKHLHNEFLGSLWSFGPLGTPFCVIFRGEDDGDIVEASTVCFLAHFLVFVPPLCVLSRFS